MKQKLNLHSCEKFHQFKFSTSHTHTSIHTNTQSFLCSSEHFCAHLLLLRHLLVFEQEVQSVAAAHGNSLLGSCSSPQTNSLRSVVGSRTCHSPPTRKQTCQMIRNLYITTSSKMHIPPFHKFI